MGSSRKIMVKLKNFAFISLELRPLTIFIGKNSVEKSILLSQLCASVATCSANNAVFLPPPCGEFAKVHSNLVGRTRKLMESAKLLLREIGIELTGGKAYVKTWSGRIKLERAPPGVREAVMAALALSSDLRFVFVEEPEAHMHPSAQRLLARAIAEAANSGKYIALTTNGDYLVGEISNLIALSNAPRDVIKKLNYREAEVLKPEAVAAYLVRADGAVERLEVDHAGIPEDEFARVAEEILRIRNELY